MDSQNSSAYADFQRLRSLLEFDSSREHGGAVIARIKDLEITVNRKPECEKNQRVTLRDIKRIEAAKKYLNSAIDDLVSAQCCLMGVKISQVEAAFCAETMGAYVLVLNDLVDAALQRRIEAQAVRND